MRARHEEHDHWHHPQGPTPDDFRRCTKAMRAAFRKAIDDEDLDGDEQVGDGGDGDVTAFSSSRSLPQPAVTCGFIVLT